MQMINSSQRCKHNAYVVSGRVDPIIYQSMLGLISAAGYSNVSSFVQEAVLKQCSSIAADMSGLMNEKILINLFD